MSATESYVVPVKSAEDTREYRMFTLENGMDVLVCCDPETDKAGAAIDVGVGSFADSREGIAHFLEHMLFLGTERFPDENKYSSTLSKYGGSSNAYTDMNNTCYYFDVSADGHLREMLDIFSSFFVCPLLTESATSRELQAVDAEHRKNVVSDFWRVFQLVKSTACRAEHPFSKFATGNAATLDKPGTRELLLDFHRQHYSANIMKLCIVGRESLDELEAWARELFAPVKRIEGYERPCYKAEPILKDAARGTLTRVTPVRDARKLHLYFTLPEEESVYRKAPQSFLSHLLGHEGKGSVLARLKALGWATGLFAGKSYASSSFSFFEVNIDLSAAGLAHVEDIAEIVFAYLAAIAKASDAELTRLWEETRALNELSFRFKAKEDAADYASTLAHQMQVAAPADVLSSLYIAPELDLALIRATLAELNPKNLLAIAEAKAFGAAHANKEQWYGTPYTRTPFSAAALKKFNAPSAAAAEGLALPAPNAFVPTDFAIRAAEGPAACADSVVACTKPAIVAPFRCCCGGPKSPTNAAATAAAEASSDRFAWSGVAPERIDVCFEDDADPFAAPAEEDAGAGDAGEEGDEKAEGEEDEDEDGAGAGGEGDADEGDEGAPADAEAAAAAAAAAAEAEAAAAAEPELTEEERAPTRLQSAVPSVELWYKLDRVFRKPKAVVTVMIRTPAAPATPLSSALLSLAAAVLDDAINEEVLYDADVAGLRCQMTATAQGIQFCFSGYQHKLPELVETVLARFRALPKNIDAARFAQVKDVQMRQYKNSGKAAAYSQAWYLERYTVTTAQSHFHEAEAALRPVTPADLAAFLEQSVFAKCCALVLVHGNYTRAEAVAIAKSVHAGAKLAASQRVFPGELAAHAFMRRAVQLPAGGAEGVNTVVVQMRNGSVEDPESGCTASFQLGHAADPAISARAQLLAQIIEEPSFNTLRTKEALGYVVWSVSMAVANAFCLSFIVQSARSPAYVDARVEAFLASDVAPMLAALDDETFEQHRAALLLKLTERDTRMSLETDRHWAAITKGLYDFAFREKEVAVVKALTKADVAAFFQQYVAHDAPQRRKISAQIFGGKNRVPAADVPYTLPAPAEGSALAAPPAIPASRYVRVALAEVESIKTSLPVHPIKPFGL